MNIWDVVGVTSYVLAFALFESLIYVLPLMLVALILPEKTRSHFVPLGSLAAIITGVWLMFVNIRGFYYGAVTLEQFLLGLGLYLISILVPSFLILRFRRFEQAIASIVDRFTVLAYIYLPLACIGALIVLIRNI